MTFIEKIQDNLASIKFWTFIIATGLLVCHLIGEYTWAGLAAGLMGVARVFEYYAGKHNGDGGNGK
jgi:hypothetical protein